MRGLFLWDGMAMVMITQRLCGDGDVEAHTAAFAAMAQTAARITAMMAKMRIHL